MSSGRAKKVFNNLRNQPANEDDEHFDINRFRFTLSEVRKSVESEPREWSLKKEWAKFHRLYYGVTQSKQYQARKCYDYFRRNKMKLEGSSENAPTKSIPNFISSSKVIDNAPLRLLPMLKTLSHLHISQA